MEIYKFGINGTINATCNIYQIIIKHTSTIYYLHCCSELKINPYNY